MGTTWSLSALDRLEIQELYARYAWGIDLGDIELALSTFAPDAWFDHLWQGRVQGHEAIRRNLESLWYDRQSWWYGRQHMMNHFIMDALEEAGTARVRCFFQILQFNVEYRNNFVFGIGTRDDTLARIGGRWVFTSLRVNAWTDMDQVPWKAELRMKPRSAPAAPARDAPAAVQGASVPAQAAPAAASAPGASAHAAPVPPGSAGTQGAKGRKS